MKTLIVMLMLAVGDPCGCETGKQWKIECPAHSPTKERRVLITELIRPMPAPVQNKVGGRRDWPKWTIRRYRGGQYQVTDSEGRLVWNWWGK